MDCRRFQVSFSFVRAQHQLIARVAVFCVCSTRS